MPSAIRLLAALVFGLAVACGGGGSEAPVDGTDPDPQPQALLDEIACLDGGLDQARNALFGLAALHRRIQDAGYAPASPNLVDLDLGSDPQTFDVAWDVDGDGATAEVRLSGELTPGADLADGLGVGEYVDVAWSLEVSGLETGAGDYRVTRGGSNQLRIVGNADFTVAGCRFEITSLDMTVNNIDVLDATPDGFMNFRTNDGVLLGLLSFQPPTRIADVSVSFEESILDFGFDLDRGQPIFD
jgi:hypothetical protein